MTEQQFLNRARTIHKKIEELRLASWPKEWTEEEEERTAVLLDDAKWTMHDVAYPA